jgi:nicotinic acid phosphoribosyltransferase
METTFLVLVNYASLIATNAARHRVIVGDDVQLLEFGLRRAQGRGDVTHARAARLSHRNRAGWRYVRIPLCIYGWSKHFFQ